MTYRLVLDATEVESGRELQARVLVENHTETTLNAMLCLGSISSGLVPVDQPDAHLSDRAISQCTSDTQPMAPGAVRRVTQVRVEARDVRGHPLVPGEFLAAIEINDIHVRALAPVTVTAHLPRLEDARIGMIFDHQNRTIRDAREGWITPWKTLGGSCIDRECDWAIEQVSPTGEFVDEEAWLVRLIRRHGNGSPVWELRDRYKPGAPLALHSAWQCQDADGRRLPTIANRQGDLIAVLDINFFTDGRFHRRTPDGFNCYLEAGD